MVRRLMPTVGCEADAIAFTEEQSGGSSSSSGDGPAAAAADAGVLLVASADGSYSTGKQQAVCSTRLWCFAAALWTTIQLLER
jgi:hypothetical protein